MTQPGRVMGTAAPRSEDERAGSVARSAGRGRKDALLDLIRSVAIIRVVLWHTWSWAWLSWIPAMPAMFFTTGALLEGSLERRGWAATLAARARRLLIPYWAYAAACWVVMIAGGWRPDGVAALTWLLPLGDPVGSASFPGLWIPLWYIRAYVWFVLGGAALRWLHRRLGWSSVLVAAAVGVGVFWWARTGHPVSAAIGDAAAYAPFVLAGMLYSARGRLPAPRYLLALGAMGVVASVSVWQRLGPSDGVVNRSYLLTMTVGLAGVALVLGAAGPLLRWSRAASPLIRSVNSRALTIYLWQGFGLVAAQRLVGDVDTWWQPVAAIGVVASVIAGSVVAFGWLEDVAARRPLRRPDWRRTTVGSVLLVGAVVVFSAAMSTSTAPGGLVDAPLSGRAVVERGRLVDEDLAGKGSDDAGEVLPGTSAQTVLEDWVTEHGEAMELAGTHWVDVAVMTPGGDLQRATWAKPGTSPAPDVAWWSMTKSVTVAWLMWLVDAGVVSLDDPLSKWVPETPRSRSMTLEQLAGHRAGIPEDLTRHIFEAHPAEEIDDFIDRGRLDFEPGEGYGYSRIGYYLLALALERASGTPYVDAVMGFADAAGVELRMDDDDRPPGPATDPDGHGYLGGPWSSGGIVSTVDDGARFLQWLFTNGISRSGLEAMGRFVGVGDGMYYGLGLIPLCPCSQDDQDTSTSAGPAAVVRSERVGLDTATGLYGFDRRDGSTVMISTNSWWTEIEPLAEFYELQRQMLDLVAVPAG